MITLPPQARFAVTSGQIGQSIVLTGTTMVLVARAGSEGGWMESAWCRNLGTTPGVRVSLYIKQNQFFIPWRSLDISAQSATANTAIAPLYFSVAENPLEPNQEIWANLSVAVSDGIVLAVQGSYLGRRPLYDAISTITSTSRRASSAIAASFDQPMISTSRRAQSDAVVFVGRVANVNSSARRAKSEAVADVGRVINVGSTSRRAASEGIVKVEVTGAIASTSRKAKSESVTGVEVTGAIASTSRRAQSQLVEATSINVTSTSRKAQSESTANVGRVIDGNSTSRKASSEAVVFLERQGAITSTSGRAQSSGTGFAGRQVAISSTSRRAQSTATIAGIKSRTITMTTTGSHTNQPVVFVVDTATAIAQGALAADKSNLRFEQSGAALTYYVDSGWNTSATRFVVEVPTVANNGTFLMQYGGSLVASTESRSAIHSALANANAVSWLAANDLGLSNNATISTASDRVSGSFAQATTTRQPLFRTSQINSLPGIGFDVDDYLQKSVSLSTSGLAIAVAFRTPSSMSGSGTLISTAASATVPEDGNPYLLVPVEDFRDYSVGGSPQYVSLGTLATNTNYIYRTTRTTTTRNGWLNGSQVMTNASNGTTGNRGFLIVGTGFFGGFNNGVICEVLVINDTSNSDRLENYLAQKYAINSPISTTVGAEV